MVIPTKRSHTAATTDAARGGGEGGALGTVFAQTLLNRASLRYKLNLVPESAPLGSGFAGLLSLKLAAPAE